ncbi:MAG: cell division topological specificity factor MinE [Rhodospirillales bacterium]|nr:cell division topological specificity factor MinE [Rhodospirillales bacterium]
MSFLSLFRARSKPSAVEAKERLQILLAHERSDLAKPDYLPKLHKELLQVIAKYVAIDEDKISVDFETQGNVSTLEVNIELPNRSMRLVDNAIAS